VNVLEVESKDGSNAKYNAEYRAITGALCTPTRVSVRLHSDSMNTGL